MEEKLESRYNVAHSQTGRKRMFSSVSSDLTESELVAQVWRLRCHTGSACRWVSGGTWKGWNDEAQMQTGLRQNTDACPNTDRDKQWRNTEDGVSTPHHRDCFQGSINPPRAGHNNLHLHYVLCKCCCRGDQILEALQLLTSSLLMCTNSDPAAKVIRLQGHLLRGGSSARVLLWDLEQICSLLLTYFWHFQDVLSRNETRPSCDQGKLIS